MTWLSTFTGLLLAKLPPSLPTPDQAHPPTRKTKLPLVMLVTLILFRFFTGHGNWKDYYRHLKSYHHGTDIGYLPNYKNFMRSVHQLAAYALVFLEALRKQCKQGITLQFADSTKLQTCSIKREFSNRVTKGIATKSKSTMGWFYGFRLHLVCDIHGRILAWRITTAAFDEREGLALIWGDLAGLIVADAGYLGYNWQMTAGELGLTLMTGVKKTMKKLMANWQHQLLKARQRVETVYSVLKLRMGIETTLPRSVMGFFAHYVWCLLAYQLKAFGKALSETATPSLTDGMA